MKPYIDSLDEYYSIGHNEPEPKENPSKKNNDEKIGIISLLLIVAFAIYIIWTIFDAYAYGESDFVVEMNNANTMNEKLSVFAIEGESYKQICPSGQCKLVDDEKIDPSSSLPTVDSMSMYFSFPFILHDNIPNPNVEPIKKEFLEKYSVSFGCKIDDIIEGNGQEIYTCHDGSATVSRDFDYRSWNYDTNAIYDAKKSTFKAYGNFTGKTVIK